MHSTERALAYQEEWQVAAVVSTMMSCRLLANRLESLCWEITNYPCVHCAFTVLRLLLLGPRKACGVSLGPLDSNRT